MRESWIASCSFVAARRVRPLRLDAMALNVLLFASWADALGASVSVELPAGATVGDVLTAVRARADGRVLPKPLVAVNHRYARADALVSDTDEVAIIPPVAGG